MSDFGTAFVCKDHGLDATRRVAFRFKTRRSRKMWCGVCERRTWWIPEDALTDELTAIVRSDSGSGSSGVIYVHRRWIGRVVHIVLKKNPVET